MWTKFRTLHTAVTRFHGRLENLEHYEDGECCKCHKVGHVLAFDTSNGEYGMLPLCIECLQGFIDLVKTETV